MKVLWSIVCCVFVLCGVVSAATYYVDINSTNPVAPYTNWDTAATNIQDAVDVSVDGDAVLVADGHYKLSSQIIVSQAITIEGINGPESTIVDGEGMTRCFYLASMDCVISGLTVTNGYEFTEGRYWIGEEGKGGGIYSESMEPLVTNCIISGNSALYQGGGLFGCTAVDCIISRNSCPGPGPRKAGGWGGGIAHGAAINCTIIDNTAIGGGGISDGVANSCTISGNRARGGGGLSSSVGLGLSMANNCIIYGNDAVAGGGGYDITANGCAIYNNEAQESGGGLYLGSAYNCTIINNTASGEGGGVSGGYGGDIPKLIEVYNSIVWLNRAPQGDDLNLAAPYYTCSPDVIHGMDGNITNAPLLVSASHIEASSPCRGAGSVEYVSGTDIDGEAWLDPPSMGCDEIHDPVGGPLQVKVECSVTNPVSGYPVRLLAHIDGAVSMHVWSFGDGMEATNSFSPIHVWKDPGTYDVVLTVYNDDYPGGISATQTIHVADREGTTVYVSTAGNDANDGSSWTLAKATIQAGVDAQDHPGGVVLVGSGTYSLTNEVIVDKRVVVESAGGPEHTIVDGQGITSCFQLGGIDCVINGLTVTHGLAKAYEHWTGRLYYEGGGIRCESIDPLVTNCWITGNTGYYDSYGGGIYSGTAKDCLIADNAANYGGGAYGTIAEACIIRANTAAGYGYGGGMFGGRASKCRIVQNHAERDGGGVMFSEVYSSLVMQNHATAWGGGGRNAEFYNCNIIYNTAGVRDGGVSAFSQVSAIQSIVRNCIVWYNSAPLTPNVNPDNYYIRVDYSCSPQLIHGVDGNITNAPSFLDTAGGDYRLLATSPCIDAGKSDVVSGSLDLDGKPRIVDGDFDGIATVDMGAYEYQVMMISAAAIHMPTVNLKSKGRCPVKILGSESFNVADLDPASVRLAGAAPVKCEQHDMNGDGLVDLMLHFMTSELEIEPGDSTTMLIGQTYDGTLVVATPFIRVVQGK